MKIENLMEEVGVKKPLSLEYVPVKLGKKNKVNILALGDVGTTLLIGLRLLGGDVIEEIGICDLSLPNMGRLEMEINQINYPFMGKSLPPVNIIGEEELFKGDVLVFCASKGVPSLEEKNKDVRMAQLEANREIVAYYAHLAKKANYKGLIAVVSDPVDPLCKEMLKESGLKASQIQGYGLGVMNTRALYFAEKMGLEEYETKGRAYGPHGEDLVIANDIEDYNEEKSLALTKATVKANLEVRDLGYKPYIAPALSSGAISILLTLRGEWHYSSLYFGDPENGAFLGIKNKMTPSGAIFEDACLDEKLYSRIKKAYINLYNLK